MLFYTNPSTPTSSVWPLCSIKHVTLPGLERMRPVIIIQAAIKFPPNWQRKLIGYKIHFGDRTEDRIQWHNAIWCDHQGHLWSQNVLDKSPNILTGPVQYAVWNVFFIFIWCFSCRMHFNTGYIKVCKNESMQRCKNASFLSQGFPCSKMWQTVTQLKAQSLFISLPQETKLILSLCLHLSVLMFKP